MTTPVHDPTSFLERWHYLGLALVIFAEEAGVPLPVPGDLFIAAMGFLASTGRAAFLPTAAVVTGATVLGASLLYLVSRAAGSRLLSWATRWLGQDPAKLARLEARLQRHGAATVVIGRLVPGLRIVMTVVAGALRLAHPTFVLGTFVAGIVWATVYFWLGYALGSGYQRLAGQGAIPHWLVPAVIAALAAAAMLAFWHRVRTRAASPHDPSQPGS